MKYKFLLCQPHAKCPDLTGWYLELRPGDLATLMDVHLGMCRLYYSKFGADPHLDPTGPYNPLKLAAGWYSSVDACMLAGKTVLVNSSGGLMPRDGTIVLTSIESDELDWPDKYDDEIITISRWPEARHYYLCSNKGRMFSPDKYLYYTDAKRASLRHVPESRIKSNC